MLSRTSSAKPTARSLRRFPASSALLAAWVARCSGVSCFSLRLTLVVAHTPAATPEVNQKVRRNIAGSALLPLAPPCGRNRAAHDHGTSGFLGGHVVLAARDGTAHAVAEGRDLDQGAAEGGGHR